MSNFGKLDLQDLLKGLIIAVLAVVTSSLTVIFDAGHFPTSAEWLSIGKIAGTAAVSYLLKNLFTNNTGDFGNKDLV